MEKGDFICVNQDVHSDYECFDTEIQMREHWEKCYKIPLTDKFNMLVLPEMAPVKVPSIPEGQNVVS